MIVLITILFLLFAASNILFWVQLWQLKEYRLDRLFVHIRDTHQGRSLFFSFESITIFFLFVLYVISIFIDALSPVYPILVSIAFALFALKIVRDGVLRKIKRPSFTFKATCITLLSFLFIFSLTFFPLTDYSFWLVILSFLIPGGVALFVFLFAFPTEIYTDFIIQKAQQKRKLLKKLQVIAVSGSYGKSSTKEAIAHVLSQKYNVVKTELSYNTPLAIAQALLKKVHATTDFFIVEMGAYKKGEIKQLTDIVSPTIGVTTAISDQHLALYGGMQDVINSEYELIHALPKNALVLLNKNSEGMKDLFTKIKNKHVLWFATTSKDQRHAGLATGHDIHTTKDGVNWQYAYAKKNISLASPLLGRHTVENILPAIFLGFYFGLTDTQILHAVQTLAPLPKTMQKISLFPGVIAIDDTFNASPESVASAVAYLSHFAKRKFLVLSPLIELGEASSKRHFAIGQQIAHLDTIFVTNKNYLSDIMKGIKSKKGKTQVVVGSYQDIAQKLQKELRKGDVIVFEGKEAGIVLKHIL